MTLSYHGGNIIRGTAADRTGGTWTNLQSGYIFIESDTQLIYYWSGSAWVAMVTSTGTFNNQALKFNNPAGTFVGSVLTPSITATANLQLGHNGEATVYVYIDSNTGQYTAKGAKFNDVISSSATAETVIQAAIDAAGSYGTVVIRHHTFSLSAGFTGFTLYYNQRIIMARGANIRVPNGYTGKVFKLLDTTSNSHIQIQGGLIDEQGTASRLWTCIDLNSTSTTGLTGLSIQGVRIVNAATAIAFRTDTNGWCNDAFIANNYFDFCKIGFEFVHTSTFTDGQSGANRNTFIGVRHQGGTGITHGMKDVNGRGNTFINCYTADFTGSQITCNITANAKDTIILGGTMTYLNFADLSPTGSYIKDAYVGHIIDQNPLLIGNQKKVGRWYGPLANNSCADGWFSVLFTNNNVGSGGWTVNTTSSGINARSATGATINSLCGMRGGAAYMRGDLNCVFGVRAALAETTNKRVFIGLTSLITAAASAADPLNALSGVAFWYDSVIDANWHIMQNNGSGASNATTINLAAADTTVHDFWLKGNGTSTRFEYSLAAKGTPFGSLTWANINTDIPAMTTPLNMLLYQENTTAATRFVDFYGAIGWQDGN